VPRSKKRTNRDGSITVSLVKRPKDRVTLERVYRKVLAVEKELRLANEEIYATKITTLELVKCLNMMLYDSKEAREDNLPTLPRIHDAILKEADGQAHLRVTARKLTEHCERLMREKITLQRQVEEANRYMAPRPGNLELVDIRNPTQNREVDVGHSAPVWCDQHCCWCTDSDTPLHKFFASGPRPEVRACPFASTHRPGIVCRVCGWFEHKRKGDE